MATIIHDYIRLFQGKELWATGFRTMERSQNMFFQVSSWRIYQVGQPSTCSWLSLCWFLPSPLALCLLIPTQTLSLCWFCSLPDWFVCNSVIPCDWARKGGAWGWAGWFFFGKTCQNCLSIFWVQLLFPKRHRPCCCKEWRIWYHILLLCTFVFDICFSFQNLLSDWVAMVSIFLLLRWILRTPSWTAWPGYVDPQR